MAKIEMELSELEQLLNQQKNEVAEWITRNLSCYHWYNSENKFDLTQAKQELKDQANKAPYADDFKTLKKYLK